MDGSFIEAKSGISRHRIPEAFMASLYGCLAPYRGCSHGCLYCDGRAEKYYVEGNFDTDICIRKNLPEILEKQVSSGFTDREYGSINIGSGVTDIYQPMENELKLTRKILEILLPTGLPLVILTKSDLILRDFDIISQFPEVLLIFTITTLDDKAKNLLEPLASSPEDRIHAIKKAKEQGFHTGVMAMPLCPYLTDQPDQVRYLFLQLKEAGADFIVPGGLTLRPGRQKELFFEKLSEYGKADMIRFYSNIYKENKPSGMPLKSYIKPLYRTWQDTLRDIRMPSLIPHSIHKRLLSLPDSIHVLLTHMQELYYNKGVDISALKKAFKKYEEWLKENRTKLRRKRLKDNSQGHFAITGQLSQILKNVSLSEITGNEKLACFIDTIIRNNAVLDYTTLKIIPSQD